MHLLGGYPPAAGDSRRWCNRLKGRTRLRPLRAMRSPGHCVRAPHGADTSARRPTSPSLAAAQPLPAHQARSLPRARATPGRNKTRSANPGLKSKACAPTKCPVRRCS